MNEQELARLSVLIEANNEKYMKAMQQVLNKGDEVEGKTTKQVNNINSVLGKIGKGIAIAGISTAFGKLIKDSTMLASGLQESQNVIDVTFGNSAGKINDYCKNMANSFGETELQARKMTGVMGSMLKSSDVKSNVDDMSISIAKLAGDMASFYDISNEMAFDKIRAGISGETEPLKQLGINMSVANLEAYAMSQGITTAYSEMSQADQTILRYNYLMKATSDAQGDFARTSNSFANQLRLLTMQFGSLKSNLGSAFINIFTPLLQAINVVIGKLVQLSEVFAKTVANITGGSVSGGSSIGDVTTGMGDIGGISDDVGDSASAMDDLGSATENAGKKAKKAKQEYQNLINGLDEIHVLKNPTDNEDSGSGSGNKGGKGKGSGKQNLGLKPNITNSNIMKATTGNSSPFKGMLDGLLEPLKTAWDNYGDWFLDKLDYFKDQFGFCCDSLKKFLIAVWNNGGKEFVQHLGEIGIAVGGCALQIGGDILKALGNLWNHLNPDNNPYTRKFIEAMNGLAESVRDFIISAGSWFGRFMELGGQDFLNNVGDIVVIVGTTLAEVLTDCINIVKSFMDSWAGSLVLGTIAGIFDLISIAIKGVAIIIEKCHAILTPFVLAWAGWNIYNKVLDINNAESVLGKLAYKLLDVGIKMGDTALKTKDFALALKDKLISGLNTVKDIITHPIQKIKDFGGVLKNGISTIGSFASSIKDKLIAGFKNFGSSIATNLTKLKDWVKCMSISAKNAIVKLCSSLIGAVTSAGSYTASLIGLAGAETGASIGATALGIALDAIGIGIIIGLVVGLVKVIKDVGDKFGWWKAISEALKGVFEKLKGAIDWVVDGVKGFFGFETENKTKEEAEETGEAFDEMAQKAEEDRQKVESVFGTSSSIANQFLDSINFNSAKLAEQFEEANKSASEKFELLSKNAQDYLNAVVSGDKQRLSEMSANQSQYVEEVKCMYSDLSEEEKTQFLATYGVVKGVNDDALNYEGLSYDERVAKHTAYCESLKNNTNMSFQEKKRLIDEDKQNFENSIQNEIEKYNQLIQDKESALEEFRNTHDMDSEENRQIEENLMNEINGYKDHITEISKSNDEEQTLSAEQKAENIKQATQDECDSVKDNITQMEDSVNGSYEHIQESSYTNMMQSGENMRHILDSVEEIKINITEMENSLNSSFEHIQTSSYTNLSQAGDNIKNCFNNALETVTNLIKRFEETVNSAFEHINQTMYYNSAKGCESFNNQFSNSVEKAIDLVRRLEDGINSAMEHIENSCYWNMYNAGRHIGDNIENGVNRAIDSINRLKSTIDNFSATLRIRVPNISTSYDSISYGDNQRMTVPRFRVNYFARGGLVDRTTPFGMGNGSLGVCGEAGSEGIVPLDKDKKGADMIGDRISENMNKNSQPIYLNIQVGEEEIMNVVAKANEKKNIMCGTSLLTIA